MDKVVSLPTNPRLVSLQVPDMEHHTISLTQINQDNPLALAPLFLPPPMTIPGTGAESTEPTLLTRTMVDKVVDKVDVWRFDLPLHDCQIPQHSDLQEAGSRDQACNKDMTTQ